MSCTRGPARLQIRISDAGLASPVEPRFDDVVRLASRLCAASVASVIRDAGATPSVPTMVDARAEQMLGHSVGVDGRHDPDGC